ncbi:MULTISPECIES: sugar phosphate isomerase/epimerase family protein [unclassified Paenibacillus]|uniref:sugar phosphate isomerase/epimerase family protein n=1 Tax=unclassified Paenibacillus TaxID=185978 RepID=UPI00363D4F3F
MITLSAFADEISPELSEQIALLTSEQIQHIDFRSVNGKKLKELKVKELRDIKRNLAEEGISVSCIGSAVGKIDITADLEAHYEELKQAVEAAHLMDTRCVRIFSFHCPDRNDMGSYRDRVIEELHKYTEYASKEGIVLLHENEKHIFGDTVERCAELMKTCYGSAFQGIFDPANFVYYGIRPFDDAYPQLASYMSYFHVKDAAVVNGKFTNVFAGTGDGQWRELLSHLRDNHYTGTMALEPHAKPRSVETFRTAIRAFKTLLEEAQIHWA